MNLSIVPPNPSMSVVARAWNGASAALRISGSAPESEARPTSSANSTVTILRSSARETASTGPSAAPQRKQNRARSGLDS